MWDELRTRFLQSNGTRQFQLRRDLSNLTQEDLSVTQYFTKIKSLWDELSPFRPSCACGSCTCGGVLNLCTYFDTKFVLNFLMGLNDSLNNARSQILLMDPLPPINRVFAIMVQEERQESLSMVTSTPGHILTLATCFDQNSQSKKPQTQPS